MKVWERAGIELATFGSAVRLASVVRHITDCASCPVRRENGFISFHESKEEGKDQESMQLRTTPDSEHHMGNTKHKKIHHTRDSRGQPFLESVECLLSQQFLLYW